MTLSTSLLPLFLGWYSSYLLAKQYGGTYQIGVNSTKQSDHQSHPVTIKPIILSHSLSQSHLLPGVVGALDGLPQVDLPGGLALEALVRRVALPQALDQARRSRDLMQPRVSESVLLHNFARHERVPFKCKSYATLQSTVLGLSPYPEGLRRSGYDIQ